MGLKKYENSYFELNKNHQKHHPGLVLALFSLGWSPARSAPASHLVPTAALVQLLTFAGLPTARRMRSASNEMKEKLDLSRSLLQTALPKQLLLFGGNQDEYEDGELHSSEGFDAQREVWLPGFSMRTCRSVAAACIYAEHVYICGGLIYGEIELRSVERLSLERGACLACFGAGPFLPCVFWMTFSMPVVAGMMHTWKMWKGFS